MVADINIEELLDPAKKVSSEEKNQLDKLKDEFPWSELIQVLYLKALKDTNDLRFSDELKRVALISHDRTKLYTFLYGAELQVTIDKIEAEMASLPEAEGLISPDWVKNVSPAAEPPLEVTSAQVPEMKLTPEIGLSPLSEIEEHEPVIEDIIEQPLPTESLVETDELEVEPAEIEEVEEVEEPAEIEEVEEVEEPAEIEEVETSEIEKEEPIVEHIPEEEIKQEIEANEPKTEEVVPEISEEKKTLNHLIISEAVDVSIVKDVIDDIELSRTQFTPQTVIEPRESESENLSSDDFISWLVNSAKAVNYPSFDGADAEPSVATVESIIDKFIQTEPQIQKGKLKEYEKGNLAAESLVDREEFVTETLAEIYVNQGNVSKAKRAFQLLSLKYPEKSIYFAARIKQLGRKK